MRPKLRLPKTVIEQRALQFIEESAFQWIFKEFRFFRNYDAKGSPTNSQATVYDVYVRVEGARFINIGSIFPIR